jgi:small-conductance mechanosensitive channel
MSEMIWTLISMVVIAVLVLIFFAWYFRGFLVPYTKVRTSRGGKVLIKVRNPLVDYYAIGMPEGKMVKVTLRGKKDVQLSIPSTAYYRSLGVVCCDIDEESGAVVTRDYNIVSTHDPVVINNLMVRQKTAPTSARSQQIILIVLLVIILLGVIIGLFMLSGLKADITAVSVVRDVGGVNL